MMLQDSEEDPLSGSTRSVCYSRDLTSVFHSSQTSSKAEEQSQLKIVSQRTPSDSSDAGAAVS